MREYNFGSGKDGAIALGSYTQNWYSCSGTSGASSLTATGTFSAGDIIFIHQSRGTGVGAGEFNTVASYTSGTITLVSPLENTYTDSGNSQAQVAVVSQASSVTGSYTVSAWNGNVGGIFVMLCNGTFSGTVNANAKGYRGGRSGANPEVDNQNGEQGEGTSGAASRTYTANGNGGGGGNERATNEQGNGGGGGGHASAGETGNIGDGGQAGAGGAAIGSADLSSGLFFGGAGGGGGFGDSVSSPTGNGNGGDGGGIIIVYAKNFSSSASLTANGENGQDGASDQGAGGAGAGGTILIKTQTGNVSGTITASAATGGSGTSGGKGDSSVGRIRIEACSLTGSTSPSASTSIGGKSYCGSLISIL